MTEFNSQTWQINPNFISYPNMCGTTDSIQDNYWDEFVNRHGIMPLPQQDESCLANSDGVEDNAVYQPSDNAISSGYAFMEPNSYTTPGHSSREEGNNYQGLSTIDRLLVGSHFDGVQVQNDGSGDKYHHGIGGNEFPPTSAVFNHESCSMAIDSLNTKVGRIFEAVGKTTTVVEVFSAKVDRISARLDVLDPKIDHLEEKIAGLVLVLNEVVKCEHAVLRKFGSGVKQSDQITRSNSRVSRESSSDEM